MKQTLLEMTQDILSSMDGEEINSISDNVEAMQVATIIKTTYYDIVSRADLPENFFMFNLVASGDNTKPVLMTVPTDAHSVLWVKYNKVISGETDPDFQKIVYLPLADFVDRMHMLTLSDTEVDSFSHTTNSQTYTIYYRNDEAPSYYTDIDDNTLLFDSYDNTVDTTLQSSKSLCYGERSWPFTMVDSFTPQLDDRQFPLLLNEAKSLAWAEMKQAIHAKAEKKAKQGWSTLGRTKHRADPEKNKYLQTPNYGRK